MGRYRKIRRVASVNGVTLELEGLRRPRAALPWELFVKMTTRKRMYRVGAVLGEAPGSHRGYWRTKVASVRGHNVRIGSPFSPHCLTVIAHSRRPRFGHV